MFKLKIFSILVILIGIVGYSTYKLNQPDVLYEKLITYQWKPEWLQFPQNPEFYLRPVEFEISEQEVKSIEHFWKPFQFANYTLKLPVKHPDYIPVPLLKYRGEKTKPQLGIEFKAYDKRSLVSIYFLDIGFLALNPSDQQFFKVPVVEHIINQHSPDKIWQDLFTKDLVIEGKDIPWQELVYNLYILDRRMNIFLTDFKNFSFHSDRNLGVLTLNNPNSDYKVELITMYKGGKKIYPYLLRTRLDFPQANKLREKIIKDIKPQQASVHLADIIYKEFKALPFAERKDQLGLLTLMSAWSHQLNNVEFLKQLLFYQEKGDAPVFQLESLYQYGIDRYQTNFSSLDERRIETTEQKIQRKIREEMGREHKAVANETEGVTQVPELNSKERIEYILRNVREKSRPKSKDRLIID